MGPVTVKDQNYGQVAKGERTGNQIVAGSASDLQPLTKQETKTTSMVATCNLQTRCGLPTASASSSSLSSMSAGMMSELFCELSCGTQGSIYMTDHGIPCLQLTLRIMSYQCGHGCTWLRPFL